MTKIAGLVMIVLGGCGSVGAPALDATATPDAKPDDDAEPSDGPLATCGNARLDLGEDCDGDAACPAGCRFAPPPGSVVIRFSGVVTRVVDESSVFSGRIVAGETPLWGRGLYPIAELADSDASPDTGRYVYTNAAHPDTLGLWIHVADWGIAPNTANGEIDVVNGIGADDAFYFQMGNYAVTPPVVASQSAALYLVDTDRTALAGDALPSTALPPLAEWETRHAMLQGANPAGVSWYVEAEVEVLELETP